MAKCDLTFLAIAILAIVSSTVGAEERETGIVQPDPRLLAQFSTTTLTNIATATKKVLSTCWSTSNKACSGKRKRRTVFTPRDAVLSDLNVNQSQLDSSSADADMADIIQDGSQRSGKRLTVWSTGYTTVTLTTTSYYEGTTVTVSALCTVSGMSQSCFG